jgi:hypothetical protein
MRNQLIMANRTLNSKGTAIIIFGEKLNYKIVEQLIDPEGRYIIVLQCNSNYRIIIVC